MKRMLAILLSLCTVLFSMTAAYAEENGEGGPQTIAYLDDNSEDHLMDIYGANTGTEIRPVIIEVHGGGFFGGTKETNSAHSRFYQEAGFTVIAPNYTHMPDADFKTIEQEIFVVLHWIEEHTEEYGLDTEHIFMSGDSAGAFLVLLTASILHSPDLKTYYEVTAPDYEISGFVLSCPVTDLGSLVESFDQKNGFKTFMAGKMGEAVIKNEEEVSHADLFEIINPETFPEVYFLTTPTDSNFYEDSVKLDAFLSENNIAHHYVEYEDENGKLVHVFNISDPFSGKGKTANEDITAYLHTLIN